MTAVKTVYKYPRLIILLRHQASLTLTEAIALIEGRESEASLHYGGREKCLNDAIQARHRVYKLHNGSPLAYWFFKRDRQLFKEMGF